MALQNELGLVRVEFSSKHKETHFQASLTLAYTIFRVEYAPFS